MTVAPLDGVLLKIGRAKKHFDDLDRQTRKFLDSDPVELAVETHPEKVLRAKTVREPPAELGLLIGDCVHNLRSALDHLVWALVEKAGNKPTDNNAFPIFKGCGGPFAERLAGLDPKGPEWAFIKDQQPYQRGVAFRDSPLWILNELAVIDKHRFLHVALMAVRAKRLSFPREEGGYALTFHRGGTPRHMMLEPDAVIADLAGAKIKDPKMDVKHDVTFDTAFATEVEGIKGLLVRKTLGQIANHLLKEILPPLGVPT